MENCLWDHNSNRTSSEIHALRYNSEFPINILELIHWLNNADDVRYVLYL